MVMGLAGSKGPNVFDAHERVLPASAEVVGALLDRLGSDDDPIWPLDRWDPLDLDRPLERGTRAEYGPFRYFVDEYEPGRAVRFRFSAPPGYLGQFEFVVERAAERGEGAARLRHVLALSLGDVGTRLKWWIVWRPLHDALMEDLLDRAEAAVTGQPMQPRAWSLQVKLLRRLVGSRPAPR